MSYTITILPAPTPRPKIRVLNIRGKKVPQAYYPVKYKKYKAELAALLVKKGIAKEDYGIIDATFFLPYPKGTPKYKLVEGTPHQKKPDVDNFLKGLMDGLEIAEVTENDSKFWDARAVKCYTTGNPRIVFELT